MLKKRRKLWILDPVLMALIALHLPKAMAKEARTEQAIKDCIQRTLERLQMPLTI